MLLLSNAAGEAAAASGLDVREADKLLGPYRATQLFGFLPYQLLMTIQMVLFPFLAKARADNDTKAVRDFTMVGVRLAMILTGLIGGTAAALTPHLLRFAFPLEVATTAAPFSRFYVLGMASLAILGVACAALTSLRRELQAMVLTLSTAFMIVTGILVFRDGSLGPHLLSSTAYATAGAVTIGAILSALSLRRAAGGLVKITTLVRVAIAVGVLFALGYVVPPVGKLVVPIIAAAFGLLYVLILVVSGELGKTDLAILKRVLGRKRADN
jgi:stage V sporulation protein B